MQCPIQSHYIRKQSIYRRMQICDVRIICLSSYINGVISLFSILQLHLMLKLTCGVSCCHGATIVMSDCTIV